MEPNSPSHAHKMRTSSVDSNWRTPPDLFTALDREAAFSLDLAARTEDHLVDAWLGPGSILGADALNVSWMAAVAAIGLGHWPVGYLNNPYSTKAYNATKDPAMLVENWAAKAWKEALAGFTTYMVCPYSPQTDWWRVYVEGHHPANFGASEVRRFPHRIKFWNADGSGPAENTGNVNIAVVIFRPDPGYVGPWKVAERYWTYDVAWEHRWRRRQEKLRALGHAAVLETGDPDDDDEQ